MRKVQFSPPIPYLRITPGSVYIYDLIERSSYLNDLGKDKRSPPQKVYTGLLTPSARKRLIKSINLLIAVSLPKRAPFLDRPGEFTFRINFLTLTLPAPQRDITDAQLKSKCLAPWLRKFKSQKENLSYVWRAERQKNGNLHFHVLSDQYLLWSTARDWWNAELAKFHFIDEFQKNHHHRNPNSTDVHAVKHVRNLASYIAKYMSKNTVENQPTPGRCWDCSSNLKAKDSCTLIRDTPAEDLFLQIFNRYPHKNFTSDYCAGVKLTEEEMTRELPADWYKEYRSFLNRIRN